jgi:tetratricopeptide (TPR) repeat protein
MTLVEGGSEACRDGWERLALGRLLLRLGEASRALACFEHAAADPVREVRAEALARIAARHRRERRHAEAAEAWQQVFALAAEPPEETARARALAREAAEALAVHREHRARDLEGARQLALAALRLERSRSGSAALQYRLDRLQRKLHLQKEKAGRAGVLPSLKTEN